MRDKERSEIELSREGIRVGEGGEGFETRGAQCGQGREATTKYSEKSVVCTHRHGGRSREINLAWKTEVMHVRMDGVESEGRLCV